jgi:excisionase family DNA binding protein
VFQLVATSHIIPGTNLRDAIKSGELKAKIIGRGYKVKRQDLDEFVNNL